MVSNSQENVFNPLTVIRKNRLYKMLIFFKVAHQFKQLAIIGIKKIPYRISDCPFYSLEMQMKSNYIRELFSGFICVHIR